MKRKLSVFIALAILLSVIMGAEVLGSNLYSDKPIVDLGQLIDLGPGFKPHATTADSSQEAADETSQTKPANKTEESKEFVINIREKRIKLNGQTILRSSIESKIDPKYVSGKQVIIEDEYAEYKTCLMVEQYLKEKGIEYTVKTVNKK